METRNGDVQWDTCPASLPQEHAGMKGQVHARPAHHRSPAVGLRRSRGTPRFRHWCAQVSLRISARISIERMKVVSITRHGPDRTALPSSFVPRRTGGLVEDPSQITVEPAKVCESPWRLPRRSTRDHPNQSRPQRSVSRLYYPAPQDAIR